jgi:hypothetical protein
LCKSCELPVGTTWTKRLLLRAFPTPVCALLPKSSFYTRSNHSLSTTKPRFFTV